MASKYGYGTEGYHVVQTQSWYHTLYGNVPLLNPEHSRALAFFKKNWAKKPKHGSVVIPKIRDSMEIPLD